MKNWLITCSADGVEIDYETTIHSDIEPGFWEVYAIAESHGCTFFTVVEIEEA